MTEEEKCIHIEALAKGLIRECLIYIAAHGRSDETLCDILKAIALTHVNLLEVRE